MSWRTIVISNTAKLDYQLGFMVVRGEETVKVHINEIEMLIVESTAVSFTAYLMNELVKNKVKVIFCDEKRNPSSELLPYYGSHDTSAKIRHQMERKRYVNKRNICRNGLKQKQIFCTNILRRWLLETKQIVRGMLQKCISTHCLGKIFQEQKNAR